MTSIVQLITGRAEDARSKPFVSVAAFAGLVAIAALATVDVAAASGPIVPPRTGHGHKPPGDHKPPRDGKSHHHGRHHKWPWLFAGAPLREPEWVCVKAYRDRRGFWRCTAWVMR